MSLYSGSYLKDPNDRTLLDLISMAIADQQIRRILERISEPRIGQLRYTSNLSQPEQGDIRDRSQLPPGFDGWLYANGRYIPKLMFRCMADILENTEYPGKSIVGDMIALPNLTSFFRINVGSRFAYQVLPAEYAMPDHTHALGDPLKTDITQTVDRCAFIWSADINEKASGGKMKRVKADQFQYGRITFPQGIPPSPSMHRGEPPSSNVESEVKYRSWDVPIDRSCIHGSVDFKSDSGTSGSLEQLCWPKHKLVPVMIYVGKAG